MDRLVAPTEEEQRQRAKRIKREKTNLRRILKGVDPDRLKAADKLLGNVAFMSVELEDLQKYLNENGGISEYQNGENQWGTKKSPQAELYTSLMQRYLPAMKQLLDLIPQPPVPSPPGGKPGDKLLGYVNGANGRP